MAESRYPGIAIKRLWIGAILTEYENVFLGGVFLRREITDWTFYLRKSHAQRIIEAYAWGTPNRTMSQ